MKDYDDLQIQLHLCLTCYQIIQMPKIYSNIALAVQQAVEMMLAQAILNLTITQNIAVSLNFYCLLK